jgi:hypothetical protein
LFASFWPFVIAIVFKLHFNSALAAQPSPDYRYRAPSYIGHSATAMVEVWKKKKNNCRHLFVSSAPSLLLLLQMHVCVHGHEDMAMQTVVAWARLNKNTNKLSVSVVYF